MKRVTKTCHKQDIGGESFTYTTYKVSVHIRFSTEGGEADFLDDNLLDLLGSTSSVPLLLPPLVLPGSGLERGTVSHTELVYIGGKELYYIDNNFQLQDKRNVLVTQGYCWA